MSTLDDDGSLLVVINDSEIDFGAVKAEITVDLGGKRWMSGEGLQMQPAFVVLDHIKTAAGPRLRVPSACAQDLVRIGRFEVVLLHNGRRLGPILCQLGSGVSGGSRTIGAKARLGMAFGGLMLVLAALLVWPGGQPRWTPERANAEAARLLSDDKADGKLLVETGLSMLEAGQEDAGLRLLRHAADRGEADALQAVARYYDPREEVAGRITSPSASRVDIALHSYAQAAALGSETAARDRATLIAWLQARADNGDNEAAGILDNER